MPATQRNLVALLAAATTALTLTSCTSDEPACVDDVVVIGTGDDLDLGDDCKLVRVDGTDTIVDVSGVEVEQVEINGDRNHVVADVVPESVRISGQDNSVEGTRLGAVEIHGDRNLVSADDEFGPVAVHGNDNDVAADMFGEVADDGDRNTFPAAG